MPPLKNLVGQVFERLTVIERAENSSTGDARWLCQCSCGNFSKVVGCFLRSGVTKSCGCLRKASGNYAKNMMRNKAHNSWKSMVARCTNKKLNSYKNYGGRGITICKRWENFANFFADMGERPDGMSLDRIDVNGNYETSNCKWSTATEQNSNTRKNYHVEYNGLHMTVSEFARQIGFSLSTVKNRLYRGWTIEEIVNIVPNSSNRITLKRNDNKNPPESI